MENKKCKQCGGIEFRYPNWTLNADLAICKKCGKADLTGVF